MSMPQSASRHLLHMHWEAAICALFTAALFGPTCVIPGVTLKLVYTYIPLLIHLTVPTAVNKFHRLHDLRGR